MEDHAYIGELLAGVVYLTVAVRLLRLGQRTGEVPEKLLGVIFLFMGTSAGLYVLPTLSSFESLWTPLNFVARVAYIPAAVMVALFTRLVFRPEKYWGAWLVWGSAILLVSGVSGSALGGDLEGFSISNGWFWLEWVGYTLPFGWAAADALHQYLQARRRVSVGLCEPSVCNRMFLWSLYGLIQMLSNVVVIGQYAAYERENVFSSTWDFLYGGSILAALVVMWFAFFPPKIYVHWINRTAPVSL